MRGLKALVAAAVVAVGVMVAQTPVLASECYYYDYFLDIVYSEYGIYGAVAEYSALCPGQHSQAMMSFEQWMFHNPEATSDTINLWWELHFISAANGY